MAKHPSSGKPLSFLPFPPTCLGIANAPTRSTIHFLLHESLALSSSNAASDKDLLIEYAIGGLVAVAYRYPTILRLEANLLRKATDYLAISPNTALAICHSCGSLLTALKATAGKLPSSLPSIRVTYESFYSSKGEQVLTGIEAILEVFKEVRYRNLIRAQDEAAAIAVGKDAIAIAEAGTFGTKYSLAPDAKDLAPMHIKYLLSVLANEGIPTSNEYLVSILTKALTIETDGRQGLRMASLCYKQETRAVAQLISNAYIALVDWQPSQALYRMKLVAQGKLAMLVDILSEFSGIQAASAINTPAPSNANYGITASTLPTAPKASPSAISFKPTPAPSAPAPMPSGPTFATRQAAFFMANKRLPNEAEKAAIRAELASIVPSGPVAAPIAAKPPVDISSLPDAPF